MTARLSRCAEIHWMSLFLAIPSFMCLYLYGETYLEDGDNTDPESTTESGAEAEHNGHERYSVCRKEGKKHVTLIGGGSYLKIEAGKIEYGTTGDYIRKC